MDDYDSIYTYLMSKIYPSGFTNKEKRGLRRKSQDFAIRTGLLYYIRDNQNSIRQVLNPKQMLKR